MATTTAIDVSQWQGTIDFKKVPQPVVIIKMSGGDNGLYFDSKAAVNYKNAKAAGKAVGLYHFAGGTDPIKEADFFIKACSPLEEADVLILDWEVANKDPDAWCSQFIWHVKLKTGVLPMIYMNTSTENSIAWTKTRATGAGLWVADYRFTPAQNVPIKHWPFYTMHQYSSAGSVPGIAGKVDMNTFFGTVTQFKKYGYKGVTNVATNPKPAPKPTPKPTPTQTTDNQQGTTPVTTPAVPPADSQPDSNPAKPTPETPAQTEPKVIVPAPTYYSLWELIKAILSKVFIKK